MPVHLKTQVRIFRGIAKNKNNSVTKGEKINEAKKKPQKPMRLFRPAIPAIRHNTK